MSAHHTGLRSFLSPQDALLFASMMEGFECVRRANVDLGTFSNSSASEKDRARQQLVCDVVQDLFSFSMRIKEDTLKQKGIFHQTMKERVEPELDALWKTLCHQIHQALTLFSAIISNMEVLNGFEDDPGLFWQWQLLYNSLSFEDDGANIHLLSSIVSEGNSILHFDAEKSEDVSVTRQSKMFSLAGTLGINLRDIVANVSSITSSVLEPLVFDERAQTVRVLVIGDSGVGKSTLLNRYIHGSFQLQNSTIGIVSRNGIKGSNVKFLDAGGKSEYASMIPSYYSRATALFIVFDVSKRLSFESIPLRVAEIRKNENAPKCIAVIGNKVDLKKRAVMHQEALDLCSSLNVAFLETSALSGKNVHRIGKIIDGFIDSSVSTLMSRLVYEKKFSSSFDGISSRQIQLGFLEKRGFYSKAFKKRWFALSADGVLCYYTDPSQSSLKGTIDLNHFEVISLYLDNDSDPDFWVQQSCIQLVSSKRRYRLKTDSPACAKQWKYLLQNFKLLEFV